MEGESILSYVHRTLVGQKKDGRPLDQSGDDDVSTNPLGKNPVKMGTSQDEVALIAWLEEPPHEPKYSNIWNYSLEIEAFDLDSSIDVSSSLTFDRIDNFGCPVYRAPLRIKNNTTNQWITYQVTPSVCKKLIGKNFVGVLGHGCSTEVLICTNPTFGYNYASIKHEYIDVTVAAVRLRKNENTLFSNGVEKTGPSFSPWDNVTDSHCHEFWNQDSFPDEPGFIKKYRIDQFCPHDVGYTIQKPVVHWKDSRICKIGRSLFSLEPWRGLKDLLTFSFAEERQLTYELFFRIINSFLIIQNQNGEGETMEFGTKTGQTDKVIFKRNETNLRKKVIKFIILSIFMFLVITTVSLIPEFTKGIINNATKKSTIF